jgi:hypothetical protein
MVKIRELFAKTFSKNNTELVEIASESGKAVIDRDPHE